MRRRSKPGIRNRNPALRLFPSASHQRQPSHGAGVRGGHGRPRLLLDTYRLARIEKQIRLDPILTRVEIRVASAASEQLLVASALYDPAVLDDEDRVGAANGGQPMRDDEGRAPLHELGQALLDQGLALAVER